MANPETRMSDGTSAPSAQDLDLSVKDIEVSGEGPAGTDPEAVDATEVSEAAAKSVEAVAESQPDPLAEEKPEPVRKAAPAKPPRRRGLSVILGGMIAAAIGAGATVYALPKLPPELRDKAFAALDIPLPTSAPVAPVADQSGKVAALEQGLAQLQGSVAQLAAVQTAVADLTAKLDALGTQAPAAASDGAAVTALQDQIDALKAQLAASPAMATQEQIAAATAEAKARIAEAESQAAKMRAESEAAAKRALTQAAIARLSAAFEGGAPMAAALAEVEADGVTVPEAVKGDVPSITALQAAFPEAARKALAAARKDTAGDTFQEKLGSFLLAQTGARSLSSRDGDGPDAVLSRAQSAVDEARFDAALSEIAALPASAQAEMQAWKDLVGRREAAQAAISAMAQSLQ